MFLVTDEHGRWHPGIGDPTFMGWLTVVAYFVTAWLCWRAWSALARRRGSQQGPAAGRRQLMVWWLGLCVLLALLGVNKQLDLQSLFTEIARDLALEQGWYEGRRRFQLSFIVGAFVCAALLTAGAVYWLRRHLRHLGGGVIGVGLLSAFVAIRAASFHHVDELLSIELLGLQFNWIMELGAILLIGRSAFGHSDALPPLRGPKRRNRLGREEVSVKVRIRSGPPDP